MMFHRMQGTMPNKQAYISTIKPFTKQSQFSSRIAFSGSKSVPSQAHKGDWLVTAISIVGAQLLALAAAGTVAKTVDTLRAEHTLRPTIKETLQGHQQRPLHPTIEK